MTESKKIISKLLNPTKLWSRAEILQKPSLVPAENGIYAWYFKTTPNIELFEKYFDVETIDNRLFLKDVAKVDGYQLLYIGISPSSHKSSNTLRNRLRGHMNGNSYGSTLRLSLGCLLSDELGITLKKIGKSIHFGDDEQILSKWLDKNAFVAYELCDEPWIVEHEAIQKLNLPLNIQDNNNNPFYNTLKEIRSLSKKLIMIH